MLGATKTLLAATAAVGLLAQEADAEILIGVIGPMTGLYATFGEQMMRGAGQAVEDINESGGVLGQRVVLEVRDDGCDPRLAAAVAEQLANAGAVFANGHFCSGSSIPASGVYHEDDILQISPASTNPQLTEQGFDNVFRVSGRDDEQGPLAADHVVDNALGELIAIVNDGSAYGQGLAEAFRAQLNQRGVQEQLDLTIAAGQRDFTALIAQMAAAGIDLVYFGGFHPEAAQFVRQAAEQGLRIRLVAGDALVSDEFLAIAGPAGEGTLLTFGPDPRRNPAARSVVQEFIDQGYDPAGYTLYAYGATQAWAQAVEAAGTLDLAAVTGQLRGRRFDTVLGRVEFDDKGDTIGPDYVLYEWRDGQLEELERRVRIEARAFVPGDLPRGTPWRLRRRGRASRRSTHRPAGPGDLHARIRTVLHAPGGRGAGDGRRRRRRAGACSSQSKGQTDPRICARCSGRRQAKQSRQRRDQERLPSSQSARSGIGRGPRGGSRADR
jgi:branched-chain amino acid transport system substrate-binding protein